MRKFSLAKKNFIIALVSMIIITLAIILFIHFKTFSVVINNDYGNYVIWDGYSISSSFDGGDGSIDNPYQIASGSTLMYFKTLIESDQYETYYNKNYKLTSNINLDNHQIWGIGNLEKPFSGNFNGNGYSIANIKLGSIYDNNNYYIGLFNYLSSANITNLNLKNITYEYNFTETYQEIYIGTLSAILDNTTVNNIGIYTMNSNYNAIIGGLSGIIKNGSEIQNCYINASINSNKPSSLIAGNLINNNSISDIILFGSVNNNNYNIYGQLLDTNYQNIYLYTNQNNNIQVYEIINENESILYQLSQKTLNDLSIEFTDNINNLYVWHLDTPYIRFDNLSNVTLYLPSSSYVPTTFIEHNSGISSNIVYVNDLVSDWDYYMGLNYTSNNGSLPSLENKNLYNENTLVNIQLTYYGYNYANTYHGYVSLTERQDTFIYYKVLDINDNGTSTKNDDYVLIELIENPFTDRPYNMGFNGWITNYPNAYISYDSVYYTRYLKVPVKYNSANKPVSLAINLYASWIPASIGEINSNITWATAFTNLKSNSMQELTEQYQNIYGLPDMTGYYQQVTLNRNDSLVGYYNDRGQYQNNGTCNPGWFSSTCTYYRRINNELYDENITYYTLQNNRMTVLNINNLNFPIIGREPIYTIDNSVAGYFEKVTLSNGASLEGYYDVNGVLQQTGRCNNNCTYYNLIQYYDSNGNVNRYNSNKTYYYLPTRDTNIIVMTGNVTNTFATAQNKPFTLTSVYNQQDYRNNAYWNLNSVTLNIYADTNIENIKMYSGTTKTTGETNPPTSTSGSNGRKNLWGAYHNVRMGRGIIQYSNNYTTINHFISGTTSSIGSASSPKKYKIIIESGIYNTISLSGNATTGNGSTQYIEMKAIYGSDYDRVINNDNALDVIFCASGQWSSNINSSNTNTPSFDLIIKSGKFGSNKYNYTAGVYVGGRYGGIASSPRKVIVEGGQIYNLIGGPLTNSNRSNVNDSYIYVKGGTIDIIIGGAGTTATYGNRIIQVTGGKINYSVFGGSNGYQGSNTDGTLNGSSYIYIGGTAVIGDENLSNSTLYGAESGSVFGIGNGRSGSSYTSVGSNDNSNIIIDGNAVINNNIYGGGNYGATGISSNYSTTTTNINILSGTIKGSVFGGGNNNGSGSSTKTSTINIMMLGGVIQGSLYGGSNQLGTIYGTVNLNIYGGKIEENIYGGGKGGYQNNNSQGTFVRNDINMFIGNPSLDISPIIQGTIYGGGALGSVNGTSNTNNLSQNSVLIEFNKGQANTLYGGGQGGRVNNVNYNPYVMGNIKVSINGGIINNVYGGNDASGQINGNVSIDLNGGTLTNVYGGGNNVHTKNTNILLDGSIVDNIYGGGNEAGMDNSIIRLKSGKAETIYGGSNNSGNVLESNINTIYNTLDSDLKIDYSLTSNIIENQNYKSSNTIKLYVRNEAPEDINGFKLKVKTLDSVLNTNTTSYNIEKVNDVYEITVNEIIHPNEEKEIEFNVKSSIEPTNFRILTLEVESINTLYKTSKSILDLGTIYGGNNQGGTTSDVNIDLENVKLDNLYGGGKNANVTNDISIKLYKDDIDNIYGGGDYGTVGGNINLDLEKISSDNIYGGGNNAIVSKSIELLANEVDLSGSLYGGGNNASVEGNIKLVLAGKSKILGSVFGGGNSGAIGTEILDNSTTTVDILGGKISNNVYGGCNTSVVYGSTTINIGNSDIDLPRDEINIVGTVFGGGESNAEGSEIYDYTFTSVTKGILININGTNYTTLGLTLSGSIFGSGNASSSRGNSYINIDSLGTRSKPNKSISIQRANIVTISNSTIELVGATDRTNEYSSLKYSINRVDLLKIKNNTTLLVQQNANLLKEFRSLVDINGEEVKASVSIGDEIVKNVDNRLYILANKSLNVTTNESATSYGIVQGMTFLGMYNSYSSGSYIYGIYNKENNDEADASDVIIGGTYVLGLHAYDMNYRIDGFYSNYIDEAYTHVTTDYVEPTPPSTNYYIWSIGLEAINYSFALTASKYSSLGTYELSLIDFPSGNTTFEVLGFNAEGLIEGVNLVDGNNVPKIAESASLANRTIGLSMKSETTEWTSSNTTKFLSDSNGTYIGDDTYLTDNQATAPSLTFYLYHAKNISLEGNLGSVVITLQARVPRNEIEFDASLIVITIDINSRVYTDEDAYDASITYGKKYEMPSITTVNITSDSQFTAYYSLYAEASSLSSVYGISNDKYHTLTSSFVLPVGTQITMIDLAASTNPKYYYYTVDQASYNSKMTQMNNEGEATYNLRDFIYMDSTSTANHYVDSEMNLLYYHENQGFVVEEFIFIFDFKESNINQDKLNNTMILELRTIEDRTSISVLSIRQDTIKYSLYSVSSNIVLNSSVSMNNNNIYINSSKNMEYDVVVNYDRTASRDAIIDTNYESNSMGINIGIYDSSDNLVSSSLLSGASIYINGQYYFASSDGVFRIKLSNKVSNLSRSLLFTIGNSLPSGNYTFKIDLFASSDGLHSSHIDETTSINFSLIGTSNSIGVSLSDTSKLIDGLTGKTSSNSSFLTFEIDYSSELANPNIRIAGFKRNTRNYDDYDYENYDISNFFQTSLASPSSYQLVSNYEYEYMITTSPRSKLYHNLTLKNELESGTYKFIIGLYDNNFLVDYDVVFIIVRKDPI